MDCLALDCIGLSCRGLPRLGLLCGPLAAVSRLIEFWDGGNEFQLAPRTSHRRGAWGNRIRDYGAGDGASRPRRAQALSISAHDVCLPAHLPVGGGAGESGMGLYLQLKSHGWRRILQQIGFLLIQFSAVALLVAFMAEPAFGMAGRSWRSFSGSIALFAR